jgi:adenylosuccinate synthase
MMKTRIVTGLGFGDEGKGRVTSYLCSLAARPLVVRYCGGHNAGHTVVINGQRQFFWFGYPAGNAYLVDPFLHF